MRISKLKYDKRNGKGMSFDEIMRQTYHVSEESIQKITPYLHSINLKKGELLIQEGTRNSHMYILLEGLVRSYCSSGERENTLWFATSGDLFCSMRSYFQNNLTVSNIEALCRTKLLYIHHDNLEQLFSESHELANWGRILAFEEIDALEWKHSLLHVGDAYARYKAFLKMRPPEIIRLIPQKHIASYLGITPSTLSRIRLKLLKEINADM